MVFLMSWALFEAWLGKQKSIQIIIIEQLCTPTYFNAFSEFWRDKKTWRERVLKAMFQVHDKDLILSDYTFCNIIKKIIAMWVE